MGASLPLRAGAAARPRRRRSSCYRTRPYSLRSRDRFLGSLAFGSPAALALREKYTGTDLTLFVFRSTSSFCRDALGPGCIIIRSNYGIMMCRVKHKGFLNHFDLQHPRKVRIKQKSKNHAVFSVLNDKYHHHGSLERS